MMNTKNSALITPLPDASVNWVDQYAPVGVRPYLKLMRLDRPIGVWLLLFPCWWGLALSGNFDLFYAALFALGALVMRGAGCVINDIVDRRLDQKVARTASRPLASGQVNLKQAILFLGFLLGVGLFVLLQFPVAAVKWGLFSLPLVVTYPFMKRITFWPQLFLGLTFNWGILVGYVATTGVVDFAALALYFAAVFWTLGYDTIYALQDMEDDMGAGIKSTALKLREHIHSWLIVFYGLFVGQLAFLGIDQGFAVFFFVSLAAVLAHCIWQVFTLDITSAKECLKKFRSNRLIGLLVLAGLLLA